MKNIGAYCFFSTVGHYSLICEHENGHHILKQKCSLCTCNFKFLIPFNSKQYECRTIFVNNFLKRRD